MIYSLILSLLLLLFSGGSDSKKDSPKVTVSLCNLDPGPVETPGPVKISDLKDCSEVILLLPPAGAEKYEGAKIIGYTLVISPKKGRTPPFVENATGNTISENARGRLAALLPGDLIILANVKLQTRSGIEDLKAAVCGGSVYTIIAE